MLIGFVGILGLFRQNRDFSDKQTTANNCNLSFKVKSNNMSLRYDDKTVNSIAELLKYMSEDSKGIIGPTWYRGHSNKDWTLKPLIFRAKYHSEMFALKCFKQDATLLLDYKPMKTYEWLFIMRHYGVPTRLLDWTESALVGLFFTLSNQNKDKDGALWVLLPVELNKQEGRNLFLDEVDQLPSFEEDNFMNAYSTESLLSERVSKIPPIAFVAPRNTSRMQAQLSVFTIHHRDERAVEEIGDGKHVWRYIIPKESKEKIKDELGMLKITKLQLFPELQSVGEAVKGV